MDGLIGIGLYTPAEAGRLLHLPPAKIARWLRGHKVGATEYKPLWISQVDLADGHVYLGFRDLMEARVAARFIASGVSAQRVREAIKPAREVIGEDRPLSTDRFRTDGRNIFLRVIEEDEQDERSERLLDLLRGQYEFKQVIDPLLKTIDFDDRGTPRQWWPLGRRGDILVDPSRAFGQPIDAETHIPTAVLAAAAKQEGIEGAARAYSAPQASVKRAIAFETTLERRAAA
jgi:uncharacterized protein (DUF433 family)